MSNNNEKDTLMTTTNQNEVDDKDLEAVSGGAAGTVKIPELIKKPTKIDEEAIAKIEETLRKSGDQSQILIDLEKKQSQQAHTGEMKVYPHLTARLP